MKNRIDQTFQTLARSGRKALIGYVTAGFPSKARFSRLVPLLAHSGLDLLEIGIPFSDPIADGATIQRASQVALQNGVTLDWVLTTVRSLRKSVDLPMILMSYSNPILSMGLKSFFACAAACGVDGLIIPDLTPEEGATFEKAAAKEGIHLIYLVAPTTPDARIKKIARASGGFIYAVALTGVTGARRALPKGMLPFLARVRQATRKPIAVGFGFSRPGQVHTVRNAVDGVIVGSALIQQIEKSKDASFKQTRAFVASLQRSLNQGNRKESTHAS